MKNKGLLLVVCGPSGVGKGTVCAELTKDNPDVFVSISATTRRPRKGETDGVSYYFKSEEQFKEMIENEQLLEWATYCGNYYGTPRKHVLEMLNKGHNVILEIDVQGALQVKDNYPEGVFVFILPPSVQELRKRIEGRGTESQDIIAERLNRAVEEFVYVEKFNYIIINDRLDRAVKTLESIITAERCKTDRNRHIIEGVCNQ